MKMQIPVISFSKEKLPDFEDMIQKEWLITNGLGGYASSTALGINTRKYHGLLVSALRPLGDRRVCLAKLDEEVNTENNTYALGTNEFQSGVFPKGYMFLEGFSVSPFPRHVYSVQNVEVRKTVFMLKGKNAVVVVYKVLNDNASNVKLKVFPYVNWRRFHCVTDRKTAPFDISEMAEDRQITIRFRPDEATLLVRATNGHFQHNQKWVEKMYLREEAARGETYLDDCYVPGYFEVSVKAGRSETFAVTAVADVAEDCAKRVLNGLPISMSDYDGLYYEEMKKHQDLVDGFYNAHGLVHDFDWLSWLVLATDKFLVKDLSGHESVIAGYHWFETWGRDTFVSLPGLMLTMGKYEDARRVFLNFKEYCRNGLIPNFVPDNDSEPAYNTVDASLWFVNAVLQYTKYTGDFDFVKKQLWETLKEIVDSYVNGTTFSIHMDGDHLLAHGPQLTWMDVVVAGAPLTPREGKAVEIQALWFNALKTVSLLTGKFGEKSEADRYGQMADDAKKSFVEKFWNSEKNCLYDCIKNEERDDSLRPNQIIAVSLDFTMLDNVRNEKIVDAVHRELLTPFGLRTLARNDSRYISMYVGGRNSRDRAYHNGTAWPWLLGPFVTSFLRTKGYTEFRRELASSFLMPLLSKQVYEAGLGTLSEIYDGEPPHKPRGCIAQAWSVAEPLRTYVEDVVGFRPRNEAEVMKGL